MKGMKSDKILNRERRKTDYFKIKKIPDFIKNIGVQKERSLHHQIKKWYYKTGDKIEHKLNKYFIDIVRGDLLIEIQTGNFSAVKSKLNNLLTSYKIRLVYPLAVEKWISKIKGADVISRRKSPKTGKIHDIFKELIHIREIVKHPNFSLEILLIAEEEERKDDGKGSWRRKGVSITDRKLIEVKRSIILKSIDDYTIFVPESLKQPYSNKEYAQILKISKYYAQKINYTLARMNVIKCIGKKKNEILYHNAVTLPTNYDLKITDK